MLAMFTAFFQCETVGETSPTFLTNFDGTMSSAEAICQEKAKYQLNRYVLLVFQVLTIVPSLPSARSLTIWSFWFIESCYTLKRFA